VLFDPNNTLQCNNVLFGSNVWGNRDTSNFILLMSDRWLFSHSGGGDANYCELIYLYNERTYMPLRCVLIHCTLWQCAQQIHQSILCTKMLWRYTILLNETPPFVWLIFCNLQLAKPLMQIVANYILIKYACFLFCFVVGRWCRPAEEAVI